jgi:NAD(P)-dependent dehydrogenase (short-subunit alcohol dehydrogenase family)
LRRVRLAGEIALVTGSTAGIGKAIAVEFARQGARVAVSAVEQSSTRSTRVAAMHGSSRPNLPMKRRAPVWSRRRSARSVDCRSSSTTPPPTPQTTVASVT